METRVILSQGSVPFLGADQPLNCFGPSVKNALLGSFWDRLGDIAGNTIDTVAKGFSNMYYGITTGVGSGVGSYVANPNNVGGLINTVGTVSGVPLNVPQNQPIIPYQSTPGLPPTQQILNPVVLLGIAAVAILALRK